MSKEKKKGFPHVFWKLPGEDKTYTTQEFEKIVATFPKKVIEITLRGRIA